MWPPDVIIVHVEDFIDIYVYGVCLQSYKEKNRNASENKIYWNIHLQLNRVTE